MRTFSVEDNRGRAHLGVFYFAKRRCADLGDWQPLYVSVKVERHEKRYMGRIVCEGEYRTLLASLEDVPASEITNGWKRLLEQKRETWREAHEVLILLRYAGARLNEACQLLTQHIQWEAHHE